MKIFWLKRTEDVSGTSGTGLVAEGVIFENGWCSLHWLTEFTSVAYYPSIQELEAIHGHNGATKVVYDEPAEKLELPSEGESESAMKEYLSGSGGSRWINGQKDWRACYDWLRANMKKQAPISEEELEKQMEDITDGMCLVCFADAWRASEKYHGIK